MAGEVGEAAVGIALAVELDYLPTVAGERHGRLRGRRRRRIGRWRVGGLEVVVALHLLLHFRLALPLLLSSLQPIRRRNGFGELDKRKKNQKEKAKEKGHFLVVRVGRTADSAVGEE